MPTAVAAPVGSVRTCRCEHDERARKYGIASHRIAKVHSQAMRVNESVGRLFGSCMDLAAIDELGARPLLPYLALAAKATAYLFCSSLLTQSDSVRFPVRIGTVGRERAVLF